MITMRAEICPQNHPCPSVRVCPTGAITQQGNQAPAVDRDLCTNCGICTLSCPAFVESSDAG
jgi:ferredoxin